MPIYVISTIKQKNAAIFPLVEDNDFYGGFRVKDTEAARDAIPATYRRQGMFVWTNDTEKLWRLNADLTSWTEIVFGGGGSSTTLTDTRSAGGTFSAGDPVALDAAGELILADADVDANHDVYGIALSDSTAGTLDVVTSGVVASAGWTLTPGLPCFLAVGGGVTQTPPDIGVSAGMGLVRIGIARTAGTMLVRPQIIAYS